MPSAVHKPIVSIAGQRRQLPVGETLDTPERSVPVTLAGGGIRRVTIGASGPALVYLANGTSREVSTGAAGVWRIGLNPETSAPVDISGKLDADFNGLAAASGQDSDLLVIRRAAANLKLSLSSLVGYITGVARSWAGKQTFSAGADISALGVTGAATIGTTLGVSGASTLSGGAQLGELGPANLKCLLLTGTAPASTGTTASIVAHGLSQGVIVLVRAVVTTSDGFLVMDGNGFSDAQFNVSVNTTHLRLSTTGAASTTVLGRPVKFFVFYQG
ncbi:hypothetical protein [Comamonas odontotermitis]|uniref:hypothetical protein n=1 Tax=Comamonas odontotermitis TaxID=379895 RepID=UPI00374FE4EF